VTPTPKPTPTPVVERNVDNINIRIPQAQFLAMDAGYQAHKRTAVVHLNQNTKKGDYLTVKKFLELRTRWIAYRKANNSRRPAAIWIVKAPAPIPTPTSKGPVQTIIEAKLGRFTTIKEYYNKMIGRGYGHYYNDVYTLGQEEKMLSQLNCSDASQLTYFLAKEMGYTVRFVHVFCVKSGTGHIQLDIKGKELGGSWIRIDVAAAMSTATKAPWGTGWCYDAKVSSYDDSWLVHGKG
jgi:hypothetical protein